MADQHNSEAADDMLGHELSAFFSRTDPVPPGVLSAARAAFEFRDIDAQLAELLRDSAVEDKELAGVRGVGNRLLTFALGQRFLEVDVAEVGGHRSFAGYVVPAVDAVVHAESLEETLEVALDERGRFRVARAPHGIVRFRVQIAGEPAFRTPWLAL